MDPAQLAGNASYENDIQPMPTQYETGMHLGPGVNQTPYQTVKSAIEVNWSVFREPRGVMRILQFIFSICAFATTTGFTSFIIVHLAESCETSEQNQIRFDYSYPFRLDHIKKDVTCTNDSQPHTIQLIGDFSSDAQFFVATGVLSFLYCIGVGVVYVLFDHIYQSKGTLPLADFILTVTLAVFWLSGSAAWANGLTGLKWATNAIPTSSACEKICKTARVGSHSGLNISVILGFLNFFLWASDLWFLYKETPWFKLKQGSAGVGTPA